jgi:hypothetical protein
MTLVFLAFLVGFIVFSCQMFLSGQLAPRIDVNHGIRAQLQRQDNLPEPNDWHYM